MSISSATLASVRTKRGIGSALKDRRADAAVRLTAVRAEHGVDVVDVIRAEGDRFHATVDELYGAGLLELARGVHQHGRLKRIGEGVWVVTKA